MHDPRGPLAVLRPYTLSSGPESGLCNQLFALIGYVVLARQRGEALLCPNFTSHDQGGTDVPLERG